jgi:hypothetical protein
LVHTFIKGLVKGNLKKETGKEQAEKQENQGSLTVEPTAGTHMLEGLQCTTGWNAQLVHTENFPLDLAPRRSSVRAKAMSEVGYSAHCCLFNTASFDILRDERKAPKT